MSSDKVLSLLQRHVPSGAVEYCLELWNKNPFLFKIRKSRQTKVGDFTCVPGHTPRITINEDLHPYLFLITYVHEVAHLGVHRAHGTRVEAHGTEWKNSYRDLLTPLLSEEIFPSELIKGLRKHLIDPKASTFSDTEITQLLRKYDPRAMHAVLLSEIPEGSLFGLNGRWFKKGQLRRTRVECRELKSKRTYLVPVDVPVENAQLSLL